ncbi:MAG: rRNA maturation RNase YbeY [Patescibacteria group bacterium]|nr:rRNA maturation RNase YbeY [Patescibacteria group bacterium]
MRIEIANKTKKRIEKNFVRKIVEKTLDISKKKPGDFSISIAFVEKKEIRRLNRIYRKKDKATDVLSFSYSSMYNKKGEALRAGELALCPEIIARNARANKVAFQKELAFVLSHGVLHLLGMKHGKKMYKIQDKISTNC